MSSSRPRNRPLGLSLPGAGERHIGRLAARGARGMLGENPAAVLDARPLAPQVGCVLAGSCISGEHPAYQAHGPRRPGRPHRVINVLCHDLPRPERLVNIPAVERETSHLRWAGRARHTAPADACRPAAPDAYTTFIDGGLLSPRSTRGSVLHLSMICTSVLVNVYSGPGGSRGKRSRGVGNTACRRRQ